MHCLPYTIKTMAPVIIADTQGDLNTVRTKDYFTGNTVLGIFAVEYIRRKKEQGGTNGWNETKAHEDGDFYKWFLSGELCFSYAYLAVADDNKVVPCSPTPLFIHRDKNGKTIFNLMTEESEKQTVAVGGLSSIAGESIKLASTSKTLLFHHARDDDRSKGFSREGGIFNYEAIAKDQEFHGVITGKEDCLKELKNLFDGGFRGKAGRSKNTQYGRIELILGDVVKNKDTEETVEEIKNGINKSNEIVISCTSPVILRNEWGYPDISVSNLQRYLAEKLNVNDGLEIKKSFARFTFDEGFVSVWKLKKPMEKALIPGSSFKLSFSEEPSEKTIRALALLQEDGIGERTGEGYGRFLMWTSFVDTYAQKEFKKSKIRKPNENMPDYVKDVLKQALFKKLQKDMEQKAINDAETYKNRPNNHLLGRLELIVLQKENTVSELLIDSLPEQIALLKKTAKDSLRRAVEDNNNNSLFDLLSDKRMLKNVIDNYYCKVNDKIRDLLEKYIFNTEDDTAVEEIVKVELRKKMSHYLITLFRTMRMLNRKEAQKNV